MVRPVNSHRLPGVKIGSTRLKKKDYLFWLIGYRALLVGLALIYVVTKPFETMLFALAVLTPFWLAGEAAYKGKTAIDEQRLRAWHEQQLREQRAEEARLRLEAKKRAQEESARKFMVFENETIAVSGENQPEAELQQAPGEAPPQAG